MAVSSYHLCVFCCKREVFVRLCRQGVLLRFFLIFGLFCLSLRMIRKNEAEQNLPHCALNYFFMWKRMAEKTVFCIRKARFPYDWVLVFFPIQAT